MGQPWAKLRIFFLAQAKKFKKKKIVAGTSGGNLLQKSKTKWRQHFNQYYEIH
jgi:hypothetical protein